MRNKYLFTKIIIFIFCLSSNVVLSQTSGPTAPEYTSFEPIDVNDMVNLSSGDFTYSLPLLEVPGPEGGYPLSISYHAGIQPLEEASWVGLGWTVNAGAITRTVNGYADDQVGATRVVKDYNEGGERHTGTLGYGLPGASVGLQVSHDTYLGWGVGSYMGLSVPIKFAEDSKISGYLGVTVGISPFGESYYSLGGGVTSGSTTVKSQNIAGSIGINTNFESVSFNAGVSSVESSGRSSSLLAVSLSTSGTKPSLSALGISVSQANNNGNDWSNSGWSVSVPIPTPVGVFTLGYSYLRYWLDQEDYLFVYGSVNADEAYQNSGNGNTSFDSYSLLDPDVDFAESKSADQQRGGNFPAYDYYAVNAQGISGTIRPYIFDNISLFRQEQEGDLSFEKRKKYFGKVGYRFVNDFSNSAVHSEEMIYNSSDQRFESDNIISGQTKGYKEKQLAGSKDVAYFTNLEIRNGLANSKGLVSYKDYINQPVEFEGMNIGNQIGAYKITKSDGMTYHFSLPVYTYGEYFRAQKIDNPTGQYHERREPQPYAYQWLLTAITGPDYVDRGVPGLDQEDWGYWVGFSYEKYVNDFQWRNPAQGFHKDVDNQTDIYSHGRKQIYYLDSVFTRTHVALFSRSERIDGREVTNLWGGGFSSPYYEYPNYSECNTECDNTFGTDFDGYKNCLQNCMNPNSGGQIGRPLLRLDKISLYRVQDLNERDLNDKSIRSIKFSYDYSLQPETPNSFQGNSPTNINPGKLTLNEIQFLGKNEESIIPRVAFEYELPTEGIQVKIYNDSTLEEVDGKLALGDIIKFEKTLQGNIRQVYATIMEKNGNIFKLHYLNSQAGLSLIFPLNGAFKTVYKTKNPPFDKDAYDNWNMFKSDYHRNSSNNVDESKYVTLISAKNKDVFSLRTIKTALSSQINIEYETDSMVSILNKKPFFSVKDAKINSNNYLEVELFSTGQKLSDYIKVGEYHDLDIHASFRLFTDRVIESIPSKGVSDIKDYILECGINRVFGPKNISLENLELHQIDDSNNKVFFKINNTVDPLSESTYWYDWPEYKDDNYCGVIGLEKVKFNVPNNWPDYIVGGLLYLNNGKEIGGGRIRVREISLNNAFTGTKNATKYSYKNGVTSFESQNIDYKINPQYLDVATPIRSKRDLIEFISNSYSSIYGMANELPSPGVTYQNVSVTEEVNGVAIPGRIEYDFQVFDSSMVQRLNGEFRTDDRSYTCTLPECESIRSTCDGQQGDYEYCNGVSCFEALRECSEMSSVEITVPNDTRIQYPITFKNYSVQVGNLKAVRFYGAQNQLLTENEYIYLHDFFNRGDEFDEALDRHFNNQGKISQAFHEFRTFKNEKGNMQDLLSFSQKVEYPNIMLGQRTTDHKRNLVSENWNMAFDWFSGQVLKTISKDSYGSYFLNESLPAYQLREYEDSLGLSMYGGKNMLTQLAAMDVFRVRIDNDTLPILSENIDKLGLLSAQRTVWSNQIPILNEGVQEGIYRKKSTYSWNGQAQLQADGTYPINDFVANPFDYAVSENNGLWEKQSEITLIDVYSHILEQKDMNGRFAVAKKDPGQCQTTLSAVNANYYEVTSSGAEYFDGNDFEENGINRNQGNVSTARSHTGTYSLLIPIGNEGFSYTMNSNEADFSQDFRASVWVYLPGDAESASEMERVSLYAEADGQIIAANSPVLQRQKSKSWYLLNIDISIPEGTQELRIGTFNDAIRAVYMDDFRIHPIHSPIVSYVYDQFSNEITHILDKDNLYTRFEYDNSGKLVRTYKEFFYPVDRTISEMVYNYAKNNLEK